jgi:hypothetical protein
MVQFLFLKRKEAKIIGSTSNPIAIGCRLAVLLVGGEDTAHGGPPRLVSPPTGDNLKCTQIKTIA